MPGRTEAVPRCARSLLTLVAFLMAAASARAQPTDADDASEADRFVVATRVVEPFVTQDSEGDLSGFSVVLWEHIAENLGLEYEFEVVELAELVEGVADGRFDAAIAAISVTPERERLVDMSHGYFMDGLGIAVPSGGSASPWIRGFANLFSSEFFSVVGGLTLLLLVIGVLVWVIEHRHNTDEFARHPGRGIGDGFWFAAVTMTTVGYGDKAPKTVPGRLLALVWMFASIILISAFTGAVASSLTAAQIATGVRGAEDLPTARVGAAADSATMASLDGRGVNARGYATIDDGLRALADGELDAFVHDSGILRHHVKEGFAGEVRMLEAQFNVGSYAIALPPGSAMREAVNREILEITREPRWNEALERYLGPGG